MGTSNGQLWNTSTENTARGQTLMASTRECSTSMHSYYNTQCNQDGTVVKNGA